MHTKSTLVAIAPLLAASVIAGCGSTSKTAASKSPAPSGAETPASKSPASGGSGSSTKPVALITTKHAKLGTVLAYGPDRLTVYLFEGDRGGSSNCSGACAQIWPPVLGRPKASGQARASDLGTIRRADGEIQVTYKGHPLYRFIKDKDDGDAYGEGISSFGADWYALQPSGAKLDES